MEIGILGPLEVRDAGRAISVTGARLRSLLTRLAADTPYTVPTSELIDAVWPEGPPGDPVNGLQSLVSRLRRALGEPAVIAQLAGGYRLDIDGGRVDAVAFVDLVAAGHRHLRDGAPASARDTLVRALALWRGEPLADAGDATYVVARTARLREQRLEGWADRIEADLRLGFSAEVVAELGELVRAHPLRERLTGQLIRALAAEGRTAEALVAYERLRVNLADELGVDPGPDLQGLYVALLRGDLTLTPVADRGRRSNLRASFTSFIGRDGEVHRVSQLLEQGRLATVVGPGGAGKTRLATEVARRFVPSFADGVWLVELASVSDAAAISQAMLGALGMQDTRSVDRRVDRHPRDSTEQLLDNLHASECLLVIDNCEHLVAGVAQLVDQILVTSPAVRILTTSREPLGIVGESLCVLPPLGLPPSDAAAAEALTYPAVQLLAERARAVSADFDVDQGNVGHIVEIVRRLDGLPLAIELATARLRVLPIGEIAARLSDRFRLLAGGNRTAVPRHRTLRAVVEWSWDLLTRDERLVAERLAVFPAGTDLQAAVAVCGDDRVPPGEVGDLLLALVDKSLLQVVGGGLRYRMLETIREYGVERLAERGELDAARLRHARHFAALAARLDPVLRTDGQLAALDVIRTERDNMLGALRYLGDCGDGVAAVDLTQSLTWYWSMIGANSEASNWLTFALAARGADAHPDQLYAQGAKAISMIAAGDMSGPQAWDEARGQLRDIATQLVGSQPPRVAAMALLAPMLGYFGGDEVLAESLMAPVLASPDPWVRAAARTGRAAYAENAGDTELMRADVQAAYADFERIGDRWGLSSILTNRAQLRTMDGDVAGAVADYEQALRYARDLGSREDTMQIHVRLTGLAVRLGDFEGAKVHVQAAKDQMSGQPRFAHGAIFADAVLATALWFSGDRDAARSMCGELRAGVVGAGVGPVQGYLVAMVRSITGFVAAQSGDIAIATADLEASYAAAVSTRDMPLLAAVGVAVAALAQASGSSEDAAMMLGAAAKVRGADDVTDPVVTALTRTLKLELERRFDEKYSEGKDLDRSRAVARISPATLRSHSRARRAEAGGAEQSHDGLPVASR